MAEEERENRNLPATARRRQKAREEGQVARSREVTSMVALVGIVLALYFGGSGLMKKMMDLLSAMLSVQFGVEPMTALRAAGLKSIVMMLPVFSLAVAFSAAGALMQGGIVLKPPKLSLSKFDPVKGIKNKFSLQGLNELIKSILKFSTGILIFYYLVKALVPGLPQLMGLPVNAAALVGSRKLAVVIGVGLLWLLLIAIVSYVLERVKFEKDLKMSEQEVKEERKETEGDPQVKSRIRSIQVQQARQRMMQEVPQATVVITNPTHLAVALLYRDGETPAPKVVAKGRGHVAQRIKEAARKHGVPIVEDKPVARMLIKLDLNSFVPPELYRAVARVLSYIYKLKGKKV